MIVHKEIKNEQKTEYQLPTTELPQQENADGTGTVQQEAEVMQRRK